MQRRTATLEDVAREAGVSEQTVSRVLNKPDVVSERTREKVIRAMQALHYVPNRSAQLLCGKICTFDRVDNRLLNPACAFSNRGCDKKPRQHAPA